MDNSQKTSFLLNSNKKTMAYMLLGLGAILLIVKLVVLPAMPATPTGVCLILGTMWALFSGKTALEFAHNHFWYKLAPLQSKNIIKHDTIRTIEYTDKNFLIHLYDQKKPLILPKNAFNNSDVIRIENCLKDIPLKEL